MKTIYYKGHQIKVSREKCLAGYELMYYTITRCEDSFILVDDFTTDETPEAEYAELLKERVDGELVGFEVWWKEFEQAVCEDEEMKEFSIQASSQVRNSAWSEYLDGTSPETAARFYFVQWRQQKNKAHD